MLRGQGLRSFYVGLLLLIAAFVPVFAQTITGDISGNVTDSSGAVLPSVSVTVESLSTGDKRSATTSENGNFRVTQLPIGNYKVTASAEGFKTVVQTVGVLAGAVMRADFNLQLGQRTETIEVEGGAPLVELSPNNNNYVDSEKIENLPINGRDYTALLAITPGVQRAPGGGFLSISIDGARTTSNNYFIDGLYNNDRYYGDAAVGETGIVGIPAVLVPPEAIQELSVQGTPSAEFGVKGGAPILMNIKAGTNTWHGSATWVNHNGIGDADNYFSNHTSDNCAGVGECKPTPIHNNQFGGTFGGPLVKDKAFLFGWYDAQRYKSVAVSSRAVPSTSEVANAQADITNSGLSVDPIGQTLLNFFPITDSGQYIAGIPTTATDDSFGLKFDFKINPAQSVTGRYIYGDSVQNGPPFAGLPPAPQYSQNLFNSLAHSRAQLAGITWNWTLSSNKILESRLGFTRFSQIIDVNNKINPFDLGLDTGPLSTGDRGVPYVYIAPLGYGGYVGGVQGYPLVTQPDQTWDWSEHFSWVKGNHTIKIGGNFQRAYTNSLRNNARTGLAVGYFTYYAPIHCDPNPGQPNTCDPVQEAVEELLLGKADNVNRDFGNTRRYLVQNSVGFYAQDDWKIKPRITLNLGLRYEINGNVRDRKKNGANFFPDRGLVQLGQGLSQLYNVDYHDFGPRAGVSWDIFGTGRTAFRAGYSLTYDVPNTGTLASPYSLARARTGAFTQPNIANPNAGVFSVSNTSDVGNGFYAPDPSPTPLTGSCFDPSTLSGDYICFDAAHEPVFGANPSGVPYNVFSVVSDFKTPRYHNFNVSVQQQISHNNVLTLTYAGQRGENLVIYRDLNASPVGGDAVRPFDTKFLDATSGGPQYLHVVQASNGTTSQYDSLQTSYQQRAWHGLDTQYNFTWSKCYDENSSNRGGAGDYPQINNIPGNPDGALAIANLRENRGLCDHDVRLNFNAGGVYSFPAIPHAGRMLGQGWQLNTIYTALSGRPFSAIVGGGTDPSNQGLTGSSIRAAWDGTKVHYNSRNPDQYVVETIGTDPCGRPDAPASPFYAPCSSLTPGAVSFVGNSRRNQLIGPGLSQWDVSLAKSTKLYERLNVELRWEVFNVLNRANFYYLPNNTLNGGLGVIKQTSDVASGNPVIAQGGPRNMNFELKFTF